MAETTPQAAPTEPKRGMATWKLVTLIVGGVLLVMVLVCGGLIAMLLPALWQARDAARSTQEMSHLRQIAIAAHAYGADHDGLIPHDPSLLVPYSGADVWTSPHRDPPTIPSLRGTSGPATRFGDVVLLWPGKEFDEITNAGRAINGWAAKLGASREPRVVWFIDGHADFLDETTFRAMVPEDVDIDALDGP